MNQPLYTVEILKLAASIPHYGLIGDTACRGEARSQTCGSTAIVDVEVDEQGRVSRLGQHIEACAFGQASSALMGTGAIGRNAADVREALSAFAAWLDGSRDDPGRWEGLGALEPARSRRARHGAMLLPFRALLAAIEQAESK